MRIDGNKELNKMFYLPKTRLSMNNMKKYILEAKWLDYFYTLIAICLKDTATA